MANPISDLRRRRNKKRIQKRKQERRAKKLANQPNPVPFIVGVNRSGTTLLRMMLDAHPELAMPPETHFIPALSEELKTHKRAGAPMTPEQVTDFLVAHRRWGDFGLDPDELLASLRDQKKMRPKFILRAFYGLYAKKQGKSRCGDKTPGYVKQMGIVQRSLPEARFIHLIRDGRDVALSREGRISSEEMSVERHALIWKRRINRARRQVRRLEYYVEVRYEDLVRDPEQALRKICEFIELPYDPAMLDYHEHSGERLQEIDRDLDDEDGGALRPAEERMEAHSLVTEEPQEDRIDRWRTDMPPEDIAEFEAIAADLLEDLGYEVAGKS